MWLRRERAVRKHRDMTDDKPGLESGGVSRREFLDRAAAVGATAGLAGCAIGTAGQSDRTVVQLATDAGTFEAQTEINDALHQAGLPADVRVEVLVVGSDTVQSQFSQWLSANLQQPSLLRMDSE